MNFKTSKSHFEESDVLFKIIIFGEGGVGKTTLIRRYLEGYFEESIKMTIGVDFFMKNIEIKDLIVSLQIWDFAGEERFRFLLPSYVAGASGGIFMYDITRRSTLNRINEWLSIFQEQYNKKETDEFLPVIILGGKIDREEDRSVNLSDAKKRLDGFKCLNFMECSSKTGENVEDVFIKLAKHLLKRMDEIPS
ncbi:MAG: GTP-binding protein [Promethearchaeota archaeon]|nr:MAG: GTP-binding protein [Candidatus Lokiarchaeota archaeon]